MHACSHLYYFQLCQRILIKQLQEKSRFTRYQIQTYSLGSFKISDLRSKWKPLHGARKLAPKPRAINFCYTTIRKIGIRRLELVHWWFIGWGIRYNCNNWSLQQPMRWINRLHRAELLQLLHIHSHLRCGKLRWLQVISNDGPSIRSVVPSFEDGWLLNWCSFRFQHNIKRHQKSFADKKRFYFRLGKTTKINPRKIPRFIQWLWRDRLLVGYIRAANRNWPRRSCSHNNITRTFGCRAGLLCLYRLP